nr:hypothetical protein [Nocardia sp. SYP-A9097]
MVMLPSYSRNLINTASNPSHDFDLMMRAPEGPQCGQSGDDVEEMAAEPTQQRPLKFGASPSMQADHRTEHRDERQRDSDDHRGGPIGEYQPAQDERWHDDGSGELRQITGEVGVERVQSASDQRDQLTVTFTTQPERTQSPDMAQQAIAQVGLDLGRGAPSKHRLSPHQPGAGDDHGGKRNQGRRRRAREHSRQQIGLQNDGYPCRGGRSRRHHQVTSHRGYLTQ